MADESAKAFLGRQLIVLQRSGGEAEHGFGAIERGVDLTPRLDERLSHLPRDIERDGFLDGSKGVDEFAADLHSFADRDVAPLLLRGAHLLESGCEFRFRRGLEGAKDFFGCGVYEIHLQLSSYSARRSA